MINDKKCGNFIRGVPRTFFMFLIFTMLYLSFGIMSVFAAPIIGGDDGSTDGAGELLEAEDDINNATKYFSQNVHWVPTTSKNGM